MTLVSAKCRRCGTSFRFPKEFGSVRFCSALCRVTYGHISAGPELKGCGKRYSKRRRAIMAQGDRIDPYIVYVHYRWMCHLCNTKINPELTPPDPMSASLDHVIPLSRGGGHVWGNVMPAHLLCNEMKSNGLTVEDSKVIIEL